MVRLGKKLSVMNPGPTIYSGKGFAKSQCLPFSDRPICVLEICLLDRSIPIEILIKQNYTLFSVVFFSAFSLET